MRGALRLRVLFVAADPALRLDQQGGAGTHMRGTIEALRRQGITVEAVIGSSGGAGGATLAQRPAPRVLRLLPRRVRLLARALRVLAHGRTFHPADHEPFDCVYERSAYLLDVGRRFAAARGAPYVVETDGILVTATAAAYGAVLQRRAEKLERGKLRTADLVVVMSNASRDDVVGRYAIPADRVFVKGLGVESSLLERRVRTNPVVDVGFAGTFQPYHGVELLIEALRRITTRSALLVGDGPRRAAIEAAAVGLKVEMPGLLPREEALDRLDNCRVLVIPESSETVYPVKLLEYAALRRPVVCPRRRAFAEFRDDAGDVLLYFQPGDPRDLARAIEEALTQDSEDRVRRLHQLVRDRYTWDAVGQRLSDRLHALINDS